MIRFTQDRGLDDYLADEMLRSAVAYEFAIVGEALNRLSREAPEIGARVPELRQAIAMRNALIHGYREVNDRTVWRTIQDDPPKLRDQVTALLSELGDQP
jgi:uncharacterized protein with HEPN domain